MWVRLCLGIVFPGPVCASQVPERGTKRAHRWQCSGQPESPNKIRPKIRPFEWDAATSAGTLEASEPHLKRHEETPIVLSIACSGSVIVLQNWVMESCPCVACSKSSAGSCSTRRSCHILILFLRGKFPHRGFCTSWTRIWGRILGYEFSSPEFWGRILGSNFLVLRFPIKRAPSKIHPQEIHCQKFTSNNSPQNPGWKIHIALLQGHFADCFCLKGLGGFGAPKLETAKTPQNKKICLALPRPWLGHKSEVRKGVGGRGLATHRPPKKSPKSSPDICPPSPKGA